MSEHDLVADYGDPIDTKVIACVTDQWNFSHDRDMPWASDGVCSICGQAVEMVRVREDNPCLYSHISKPHTRVMRWFSIREDELDGLLTYREEW